MIEDLQRLQDTIQEQARERGLTVFPDAPDVSRMGVVSWQGDTATLLDLARQVGASLVYLELARFDHEQSVREAVEEAERWDAEERAWLIERVMEDTSAYARYGGEPVAVRCVWVREGVAHVYLRFADWDEEYFVAVREAIDRARDMAEEDRRRQTREESDRLTELAKVMARHKRFGEASNEDKREFMAGQLFPDAGCDAARIAKLAVLYHWWEVEPGERAETAERVSALRGEGHSVRNIAAMLNLSEARVRQALAEG